MGVCKIRNRYGIDYYFQGRRIREVVKGGKREAQRKHARRIAEIDEGRFNIHKVKGTPYFEDFVKEYAEWAKVNHRSYETMDAVRIRCLLKFFRHKRLHEITSWLIEGFKRQREKIVKPATVNRELAVLSSVFSKAIMWGKLDNHPIKAGKVTKLKEESPKERILTDEEEKKLLELTAGWFKDMLIVAIDTGMRLSELLGLRREDVNLSIKVLTVRNTKSGRDRRIPLTQRAFNSITERICNHPDSEHVFPQGRRWKLSHARSAFRRACQKAFLEGLRFHDLRHTFATRLVTSGSDIVTVQKLLGHRDLQMTQRYAHPSSEDMKRAIQILEGRVKSSQQMDINKEMRLRVVNLNP
jgi:integrase